MSAWLVMSLAPVVCAVADDEPEVDLARYYGFQPVEIFKLEARTASLVAGDFNHDGRTDIASIDNSHSRIDLLLQRESLPDVDAAPKVGRGVNQIDSHWRFELQHIPVDRALAALSAADFNGDGRTDLAYLGTPDRLVIRSQPEAGEWTDKSEFRLPDINPRPWCIAAGDVNGDDRADLVALGKKSTFVLTQRDTGGLELRETLRNTAEDLGLALITDVDGDSRDDLVYQAQEGQTRIVCARLQTDRGRLGPEYRFTSFENPRGVVVHDIDGKPGDEFLAVDSQTNRVRAFRVQRPQTSEKDVLSSPVQYGYGRLGSGSGATLAVGDVDGDGAMDLIVTDPDAAEVILYRQIGDGGLDQGTAFPSYLGVGTVRAADLDGDGAAEVVVLSTKENALGVSRMEQDRLAFPSTLSFAGELVTFDLADLNGDGTSEIVSLFRKKEGKSSRYQLEAVSRDGDSWKKLPLRGDDASSTAERAELELTASPERMLLTDANRDGRIDFLFAYDGGRPPQLFLADANGAPVPTVADSGIQLKDVAGGGIADGMLDAPALLVAQGTFARAVRVDEMGRWQVVDQYNVSESTAKIRGAVTLDLDGAPGNEVVLVDSGVGKVRVFRSEEGRYQPWKEVELGSFPYRSTHVADLNGDQKSDLVLFGDGRFAVMYAGQSSPRLEDVATFESDLENVFFADLSAGDLNGDGRADIAIVDTRSHFLEISAWQPESEQFRAALHFRVFEEKSFARKEGEGSQPREILIADVTGDGKSDLVLLSHDRVLLYPQDGGEPLTNAASASAP